jgi:peptidoglycan hydrolase CwlO-like protein
MKAKLLFWVFIFVVISSSVMWGCLQPTKPIVPIPKPGYDNVDIVLPKTVVIDGCEYIQWQDDHTYKYITPNIRSLTEKIDSLTKKVNSLNTKIDLLQKQLRK